MSNTQVAKTVETLDIADDARLSQGTKSLFLHAAAELKQRLGQ